MMKFRRCGRDNEIGNYDDMTGYSESVSQSLLANSKDRQSYDNSDSDQESDDNYTLSFSKPTRVALLISSDSFGNDGVYIMDGDRTCIAYRNKNTSGGSPPISVYSANGEDGEEEQDAECDSDSEGILVHNDGVEIIEMSTTTSCAAAESHSVGNNDEDGGGSGDGGGGCAGAGTNVISVCTVETMELLEEQQQNNSHCGTLLHCLARLFSCGQSCGYNRYKKVSL